MATASTFINAAARSIRVKRTGVDLTDNQINDAIETMNDVMAELDSEGVKLGYSIVLSATDEVTIPDWANAMLKTSLAIRLADDYGRPVSGVLAAKAANSFDAVLRRVVNIGPVSFPSTLPTGQGLGTNAYNRPNFFPDNDFNDLDSESGQGLADDRGQQIDIGVDE
jgi:hypothetical protein